MGFKVGDILEHNRRAQVVEILSIVGDDYVVLDRRLDSRIELDHDDLLYYYKPYKMEAESVFDQDPYSLPSFKELQYRKSITGRTTC